MRDSSLDDDFDGGLPPRPDPSVPATAVIDAHGVVTGWSSEAERLLGYGHDEVVGQPASRLLGSDAARSTEWFLAMPFGWGGRSVLRRRDGRHLDVSVRVYPSLDGHGRPQRLIVVSPMDRRHWGAVDSVVEEAFDQATLPMAIFDNELRTLRTSRGMQREAGRTEEQMRGRRPSEFLAGSAGRPSRRASGTSWPAVSPTTCTCASAPGWHRRRAPGRSRCPRSPIRCGAPRASSSPRSTPPSSTWRASGSPCSTRSAPGSAAPWT